MDAGDYAKGMNMKIAIIGGTGIYSIADGGEREVIATPYGDVPVYKSVVENLPVIFIPRHGEHHHLAPHEVNYRGNIWALAALGVEQIIATQAVGSMEANFPPRSFVMLTDFIDFTRNRPGTFFAGVGVPVHHVDVSTPYCPNLAQSLISAAAEIDYSVLNGGIYACMEGPRFETSAEIRMLSILGANLVGMTSVPEVVLAREAGVCYASLSIVCNWAAGIATAALSESEVTDIMDECGADVRMIIRQYLRNMREEQCNCINGNLRKAVISIAPIVKEAKL